jgi:hypothetical protein|tara:strand:+ start:215 stop:316 length:102 start_codon:yes stop_codon:yes gene_type:complete
VAVVVVLIAALLVTAVTEAAVAVAVQLPQVVLD